MAPALDGGSQVLSGSRPVSLEKRGRRAAAHSRTRLKSACASLSRPRMARGATLRRCCSSPLSSREAATRKAPASAAAKTARAHTRVLQVVLIVDAFFFEKVAANDSIRVLAIGSAEAYAAALADPEARWRKPVTLVHAWLDRLKEHYEVRRSSACAARRSRSHDAQLLARLFSEAPKETVIVGHSLDIAVKLIEARLLPSSQRLAALTPPQETKRARCATVVLQPWILRSKDGATSFHTGMQSKAGYPRWLKSAAFKMQDAMIDFAYCPQLNAFRCAPVAGVWRQQRACGAQQR